jgi:uncharacterized protein (TIGR00255 family)
MIHSMTGYAAVAVDTPRGRLGLELRSVNGRFLDLQFRIVEELRIHEPLLREMLSARLARGKVECRLQFAPGAAATQRATLNADALAELARLAAEAKRAVPDAAPLRVADVLRWPGVMTEDAPSEAETRGRIEQLAAQALDELVAARAREGAKLAEAIRVRIAEMRERVAEAAPLVPQAIAAYQEKIAQRLRDALGSADDERVRAELALFGTRVDVDEELTRLGAHLDEVLRVLGERAPAGKRLDFLAQELNREANTLASKAASQGLADTALALKLLVEQMREQVQNIE